MQAGVPLSLKITSGPNAGNSFTANTNAQCEAFYTYTGDGGAGVDQIEACFTNSQNEEACSAPVTFEWGTTTGESVITSFTLVNYDNNKDIREIKEGDIINLADLPTMNVKIRANTTPPTVGSVILDLDGKLAVENIRPYRIAGPLTPGNHTIVATPYSEAVGKGAAGTPLTVHFTVVYQVVNSFTLVNGDNHKNIMPLKDGDVINLAMMPTQNLKIKANTMPTAVGSVVFDLDGSIVREGKPPYRVGGPWSIGNHTLTATPYSGPSGNGYKGAGLTITFSVVNNPPTTNLKATPNPFMTQTSINFSVPNTGYTTLEVVDHRGAVVERLYSGNAEGGRTYNAQFNRKQLKGGVYFLRLSSGKFLQSSSIMLMQ